MVYDVRSSHNNAFMLQYITKLFNFSNCFWKMIFRKWYSAMFFIKIPPFLICISFDFNCKFWNKCIFWPPDYYLLKGIPFIVWTYRNAFCLGLLIRRIFYWFCNDCVLPTFAATGENLGTITNTVLSRINARGICFIICLQEEPLFENLWMHKRSDEN